jgi:signal transduction histidine kinase
VRADPWQIGQVFMNLAANSHDAMPQRGRFKLGAADFVLTSSNGGQ